MALVGANPPDFLGGFALWISLKLEGVSRLCVCFDDLLQSFERELMQYRQLQLLVPGVMPHVAPNFKAGTHNFVDAYVAVGVHGEPQGL